MVTNVPCTYKIPLKIPVGLSTCTPNTGTAFEGKDKGEVFNELDKNKDGKIDLAEALEAVDTKKADFIKYAEDSLLENGGMTKEQYEQYLKDTEGSATALPAVEFACRDKNANKILT
jgi:hypothetical protein